MNRISNPFLTLLIAMLLGATGSDLRAAVVSVQITDPPTTGTVALALFDSANTFGDLRNPAHLVTFPLDGRDSFQLKDIPPGEYALLVYYDENDNLKMDKNFIGIPTEPLAFSNGYKPKGPPSYSRAVFLVTEDEQVDITVELYRPLGKRGRLGVGLGAIMRTSPYRDYDGGVSQVIPAITYNGDRLQILGPNVQFGLAGTGKLRLAATGRYRIGVYEEDDSDYLVGMGDRNSTFMAGLAALAELPEGFDLAVGYQHDVLDEVGGGEASIVVDKSFQLGTFRFSPSLGINWMSSDIANHDFGVPEDAALPGRPAYDLGSAFSLNVGLGIFYEITTDWLVVMNITAELFDDDITASPIVEKDYVVKGFFAVNYVF